jgi:hypothetical protein
MNDLMKVIKKNFEIHAGSFFTSKLNLHEFVLRIHSENLVYLFLVNKKIGQKSIIN